MLWFARIYYVTIIYPLITEQLTLCRREHIKGSSCISRKWHLHLNLGVWAPISVDGFQGSVWVPEHQGWIWDICMELMNVTQTLHILKRQLYFLWTWGWMALDTAASPHSCLSHGQCWKLLRKVVFVRQLLHSSTLVMLDGRGEFLS